jgi:hypothetical protein
VLIIIFALTLAVASAILTADRACLPRSDCLFPVDCQACEVPQTPSSGPWP